MPIVYHRGTIILARQVPDQSGANPKDRPVLLLIDFEETHSDAYGVAISTTFPHPPPLLLKDGSLDFFIPEFQSYETRITLHSEFSSDREP